MSSSTEGPSQATFGKAYTTLDIEHRISEVQDDDPMLETLNDQVICDENGVIVTSSSKGVIENP